MRQLHGLNLHWFKVITYILNPFFDPYQMIVKIVKLVAFSMDPNSKVEPRFLKRGQSKMWCITHLFWVRLSWEGTFCLFLSFVIVFGEYRYEMTLIRKSNQNPNRESERTFLFYLLVKVMYYRYHNCTIWVYYGYGPTESDYLLLLSTEIWNIRKYYITYIPNVGILLGVGVPSWVD